MSVTHHPSGPVVIGVGDSSGSRSALRYGLAEARRLGTTVRLVHVVPDYLPATVPMPAEVSETGGRQLREVAARAAEEAPDLEIEPVLLSGGRAHRLAHAAEDARVLVVGHDARSGIDRLLRGNVATAVAARARCPVVTAPRSWPPDQPRGLVVVGVRVHARAGTALREAFQLAADTGASVRVLHAWMMPSEYADLVESRLAGEEWRERGLRELDSLVEPWRGRYPGVEVEPVVVHDVATHALVQAAVEADEVVISRRRHVPGVPHLGTTARAVLAHAGCPVRVVSPEAVPADEGEPPR